MEYEVKRELSPSFRSLLYQTVNRAGVDFSQVFVNNVTLSEFFHHATVEFQAQDGRERSTGNVDLIYTVCIFENRGRRAVGIAKRSELDEWNDEVGQTVAFVRAVRKYLLDTSMPVKVDKENVRGVYRTHKSVSLLLGPLAPVKAHQNDITYTGTTDTESDISVSSLTIQRVLQD